MAVVADTWRLHCVTSGDADMPAEYTKFRSQILRLAYLEQPAGDLWAIPDVRFAGYEQYLQLDSQERCTFCGKIVRDVR